MGNKHTKPDEGITNSTHRKKGFLSFHLLPSSLLLVIHSFFFHLVMGIPHPSTLNSNDILVVKPTTKSYLSLFRHLLKYFLKLSGLLLTPSSSTQPTHLVLWEEL
ncbi:hypothetical protein AMECASPLE_034802 [Ameca splendens]|uniref:Transmembrane protein n=1 Tax=Ameca splendens TaxID=208324 RepID=A0ABV0YI95_9TELE